jgi:hypothetical protein
MRIASTVLNSYSFSDNFEWPYYVPGCFFLLDVSELSIVQTETPCIDSLT